MEWFQSDSTSVLHGMNLRDKQRNLIANRVCGIREYTDFDQCNKVATQDNPVATATRGTSI